VTRHEPLLPFGRRHLGRPRGAREADGRSSDGLRSATTRPRETPAKSSPFPSPSASGRLDHASVFMVSECSRGVPCESLDVAENLSKEGPRQVAFGQLKDKVLGMPNEAAAGLEQPPLLARQ
jgi:hypothetical protein